MKVLITGAGGFIGSSLVSAVSMFEVVATVRNMIGSRFDDVLVVGNINHDTDWNEALTDVDCVIHTAARAHVMKDEAHNPIAEYRNINIDGTLNLARQAVAAGVKRFIFLSSIGVNGNVNARAFTEHDDPSPTGAYAVSKWEAEQGLWKIQKETGMEVVVIRPPLVYGPNAPGNFSRLVRLVDRGWPLPFGAIHNKRSFVALDNLIDLVVTCIDHPAAANQVFLAGDGEDLSTSDLLRGIARAMGKPSRLIPFPESFLRLSATLIGKKALADRLLDSLQVDISKARDLLGWEPPLSVEEGLKRCFEAENNR